MDFAIVGGNVTDDGGSAVFVKGLCYGTMPNPELYASVVNSEPGVGGFYLILDNLTPETTYYARAFAQSNIGISYGNNVSFTTN